MCLLSGGLGAGRVRRRAELVFCRGTVVCNPIRRRVGSILYTPFEITTRRCALKNALLGDLSIDTPRGDAVRLMTSVGDKGVGLIKEDGGR